MSPLESAHGVLLSVPAAAEGSASGFSGLSGVVVDIVGRLGAVGAGLLTLLETVFPPIPSEVVLPLAGYLAGRGDLDFVAVLVAATVGSVVGALLLYAAGARLGRDRANALLCRLPLVEERDVLRAESWFDRHGQTAVLGGRLVPGVRSLVSLPAGAQRMPLWRFTLLTTLGSLAWNTLLVGAGALLGRQWQVVEQYADVLNYAVTGVVILLVGWFVVRRLRRRSRRSGEPTGRRHGTGDPARDARPDQQAA
jgi:membrane protein DedA with SNARE-associated domain